MIQHNIVYIHIDDPLHVHVHVYVYVHVHVHVVDLLAG